MMCVKKYIFRILVLALVEAVNILEVLLVIHQFPVMKLQKRQRLFQQKLH